MPNTVQIQLVKIRYPIFATPTLKVGSQTFETVGKKPLTRMVNIKGPQDVPIRPTTFITSVNAYAGKTDRCHVLTFVII